MNLNINIYFIYYWIFCIIFETIYCYYQFNKEWKIIRQNKYYNMFILGVKDALKEKGYYKNIFNPINYVLFFLIICIISPIYFLFSIKSIIKDLINKPKSEVGTEQVVDLIEKSEQESSQFMKEEKSFLDLDEKPIDINNM